MVSKPSSVPQIEAAEDELGVVFQGFEIENPTRCKNVSVIVTKMMEKNGFEFGKGLGANLQGFKSPINLLENHKCQGLGYEPTLEKQLTEKASIKAKIKDENLEIPHIKMTFPMPAEVLNQSTVAMVSSSIVKAGEWITTDDSGRALGNWEFEDNFSFIILE